MVTDFELARLLANLEVEAAEGSEVGAAPLPASLPLSSITTLPKLFQVRELSPAHVEDIARALREGGSVPPLLVLRVGGRAILLDGHHRLEAHRKAGLEAAPVAAFTGSIKDAVLEACAANSTTKLPMTQTERQDAGWRYVLLGGHSKAQIARASGCSPRSVATMRSTLKRLGTEAYLLGTWGEAMTMDRMVSRKNQTEEEREEWMESAAQRYADLLARTFAGKLTSNPEIAARAFAIHFGRRLEEVAAHLGDWLPDQSESEY